MATELPKVESTLEIFSLTTHSRRIVHREARHFEAPNWSRDGRTLLVNSSGLLYGIPVTGGAFQPLDTGRARRCNNDHGYSPCGRYIAISDETDGASQILTVPATGGVPKLVTTQGPSYWHGWSPDGTTLVYCAGRLGQFDIYSIGVDGGRESRLTDAPGLDDGPDFSPCGRYIYFNSDRTGNMRIYRMKSDGSEQTQLTFDSQFGDWFAHPSPNGRYIVFVSYDCSVKGHPPNQPVVLRLMNMENGRVEILCELFGGQGTINVPSWSPDGNEFAFVSYKSN
jgi:Tol biopolymer transport system component